MNSPADRSPQPPNDEHEHRITKLEVKVEAQHQDLVLLKPHIDHRLNQLELRIRNEILVTVHAAEQRLSDQMTSRFEAWQKRQDEQFRWIVGLLVIVLLSNSAAILTAVNLLLNR